MFSSMQVAILSWKQERVLLSLISDGIEFQRYAPLYRKLFFMKLSDGGVRLFNSLANDMKTTVESSIIYLTT